MFQPRNRKLFYSKEIEEIQQSNENLEGHAENRIKKFQNVISNTDLLRMVLLLFPILLLALYKAIKYMFSKPKSLQGKVCLVTGAGRGLGRELCLELAKQGAEVVCIDIREEANLETVKLIKDTGGKAHGYTCNVAKYEEVIKLAEIVQRDVGRVYMLINNAALIMVHKAGEWPPDEVVSMFNVNVISNYWTIQAFLPAMKEVNKGHIVNIVSAASFLPLPALSVYGATKTANESMIRSLRLELKNNKGNKIKVTSVHPCIMNTNDEISYMYLEGRVSMLQKEDVADTIIEGIKCNKAYIVTPKLSYLLLLANYLPEMMVLKLCELLNMAVNIPTEKYKKTMPFKEIEKKCL